METESTAAAAAMTGGRRAASWVAGGALLLVSGCGLVPSASAEAMWTVAPDQTLDAQTTRIRVLVTRLGCNSGVTGEVQEPEVRLEDEEVVLAFIVTPGPPDAATCQGNPEVAYDVVLPEPLGDRSLVDGQCLDSAEAGGTSFCEPDGVRFRP